VIAFLRRRGMLKGVLGGNRFWTAIWVATALTGVIRRFAGDKPDVVYSEELQPGDALVIKAEALPPRS
jgi:hypothetical protein